MLLHIGRICLSFHVVPPSQNDQLETLTKGKSVSEGLRNVALANEKITANDLKWYSDIREELKDFQIPVDDQLL
jgi:CRISPR/Cas system CSM-associated protein Csm3 (group 7 of RAMP superfamily)